MNDWIVQAEDLWKGYRTSGEQLEVIRGLSLEIRRGEFLAIQGASGVGKSTLLHLLGGLDRPDRGRLVVAPEPGHRQEISAIGASALNRFRNEQVGFVFQFHHLLPEFTALENTLLPALVRGDTYEAAAERAALQLEDFGLGQRLHHRPNQLSGGEAQRVAIARALINEPGLLLMDEPTGNLDRARSGHIFDLLGEIHRRRGQTMVVVTHDSDIAALAERRLYLIGGSLQDNPSEHSCA